MLYPGKTQSPNPAVRNLWVSPTCRHQHQDQQTAGRFWTGKGFNLSKAAVNTHRHTEQTHLYNPGHLRQVQPPCCYIL